MIIKGIAFLWFTCFFCNFNLRQNSVQYASFHVVIWLILQCKVPHITTQSVSCCKLNAIAFKEEMPISTRLAFYCLFGISALFI
ncbi:hypothetical protein HMPREF2992_13790 [Prevotella sp. HMSC069G02]|nr:hypothetical protein HMPREF2992_13790 [Prevotella sp. HMSC069G02]